MHYFCHKTPALIRWQYSAAGWLTFCSPSTLWIVIGSANIQTLLLMTLSHRLLLTNSLCFVTKQNSKNKHPTSALIPNKFIHWLHQGIQGDQPLSLLVCLFSFRGNEIRNLRAPTSFWSLREVSEMPSSYSKLETSCHTSTSASIFFLSLIMCPYQPSVQRSNISGQFLCPS